MVVAEDDDRVGVHSLDLRGDDEGPQRGGGVDGERRHVRGVRGDGGAYVVPRDMAQVEVFPGEFGEVPLLVGDHLDQAGVGVDRSLVPVPLLAVHAVHEGTAAGVAAAVGGGERQGEVPDGQGGGAGVRSGTRTGSATSGRRELPLEPTIDADDFLHRLQAHLHDVSHHSRHQERPSVIAPSRPCHARFH